MPQARVSRNRSWGRQLPPITVIGALLVTSGCGSAGGSTQDTCALLPGLLPPPSGDPGTTPTSR